MEIELCTVGGYEEVGKNMTAIRIGGEAVVIDMGIHPDSYIKYTEDEDIRKLSSKELIEVGAIPDISAIDEWRKDVKAVIPTHAHLDHLGAIPFLAKSFPSAAVLGSPFTISVLRTILSDEKMRLHNDLKQLTTNSFMKLSSKLSIEFINVTHSTPETVMVAIHTQKGIILYANDFKFDRTPVLGKKPNFKKLEELGRKGVMALIVDSIYAKNSIKTPSESVARQLLKDVMLGTEAKNKLVVVTTFSSHLARLKSIVDMGRRMNREILFLGRSLSKYITAGESIGLVSFSKKGRVMKYGKQIKRVLKKISPRNKGRYLLIVTGHQGEPKATLPKIVNKQFDLRLGREDHVIFSCRTIPTETNMENRKRLEESLKGLGVRIFKDIHVSGHAAREDLRDLINLVKPKKIIPAHGNAEMKNAMAELALEMGYKKDSILLLNDGNRARL